MEKEKNIIIRRDIINYLDKLIKDINKKQRKQRMHSNKNLIALTVLGVVFVGTVSVLLVQKCGEEIRNIIIGNANYNDEEIDVDEDVINEDSYEDFDVDLDVDEDVDEEIEDEIKQTLEKQKGKSIGSVGAAMEEALEDIEDDEEKVN